MFSKFNGVLLAASFLLAPAQLTRAQSPGPAKVAIINAQKAVADTQEIKKAQASLEVKFRPRQQQLEALNRDLQTIQQQLRAPNMTPDREAQLNADGTRKQKELQRINEDLQADVDHERQDILGKAGRQMQEVVKKLAEERNIDVVVEFSTTLYFKPALDITADATTAYDKQFPAR